MYAGDELYGDEITSWQDRVWGGPGGRDLYGNVFMRPFMRPMKRSPKFYQVRRVLRAVDRMYDEAAYWAEYRHERM